MRSIEKMIDFIFQFPLATHPPQRTARMPREKTMWNSTIKTVVMAVALVGLGTGCELADILNQLADQVTDPSDPSEPGPTDPADPTDPPDCGSIDANGNGVIECDPIDPWLICEVNLDDCLSAGTPEDECFTDFDLCVEDSEWPDDPPQPIDECEWQLDECLNDLYTNLPADPAMELLYPDEDACWIEYDECNGWVEPPPPPPECEIQLEECLGNLYQPAASDPGQSMPYPDEDICWIEYDECNGWVEPPPSSPCDELFGLCIDTGVDAQLCDEVYGQCEANQGGVEPDAPTP